MSNFENSSKKCSACGSYLGKHVERVASAALAAARDELLRRGADDDTSQLIAGPTEQTTVAVDAKPHAHEGARDGGAATGEVDGHASPIAASEPTRKPGASISDKRNDRGDPVTAALRALVAELVRLGGEATPGPWYSDRSGFLDSDGEQMGYVDTTSADAAALIVALRNALPALAELGKVLDVVDAAIALEVSYQSDDLDAAALAMSDLATRLRRLSPPAGEVST